MVQAGAAVTEELLFRGLALQALEQLWGSRAAIAVTSLFFGVAHLGADGATLWSGVAIAVEAGVLLGAAFLWRRSIWFVVGLHFAWNTTEHLLGIPVSGHTPEGLFTVDVHGSTLLTGGAFGLEGHSCPSWSVWPSPSPCSSSPAGPAVSEPPRRTRRRHRPTVADRRRERT